MSNATLAGLNILNTRPFHQAVNLTRAITELGGNPIHLPTMLIEPTSSNLTTIIPKLTQFDIVIFMSDNAVNYSIKPLLDYWGNLPATLLVGAVGPATTQRLADYGITVSIIPQLANSEGLLSTSVLQRVSGRKILIIRGQNGRKILDHTLCQRGASLQEIIVYRRSLPKNSQQNYLKIWQQQSIDIILCTSIECMQNLFILLGDAAATGLCHTPWLCISERVASQVSARGVKNIHIAANANMLEALNVWAQHCKDPHYG